MKYTQYMLIAIILFSTLGLAAAITDAMPDADTKEAETDVAVNYPLAYAETVHTPDGTKIVVGLWQSETIVQYTYDADNVTEHILTDENSPPFATVNPARETIDIYRHPENVLPYVDPDKIFDNQFFMYSDTVIQPI